MSTLNIGFYEDLTKIIFKLSSNTHLISSSEIAILNHHTHTQANCKSRSDYSSLSRFMMQLISVYSVSHFSLDK